VHGVAATEGEEEFALPRIGEAVVHSVSCSRPRSSARRARMRSAARRAASRSPSMEVARDATLGRDGGRALGRCLQSHPALVANASAESLRFGQPRSPLVPEWATTLISMAFSRALTSIIFARALTCLQAEQRRLETSRVSSYRATVTRAGKRRRLPTGVRRAQTRSRARPDRALHEARARLREELGTTESRASASRANSRCLLRMCPRS
jgi:hypothetical protein